MTGEDNTHMMQNPIIPTFEGDEASEISANTPYSAAYDASGMMDQSSFKLALDLFKAHNNQNQEVFGGSATLFDPQPNSEMYDKQRSTQNMTRCVKVPSSEHVAEIVGRQGSKIKALRAKSNTYIKTPMRGEEPIFVVTGRQEDVAKAAQDILSAAEHFTQIRACRKNQPNGAFAPGPPSNAPGSVTKFVTVPYRVVGLVVGPKGATIKRIQQNTATYIVTPSREKDPIFEVTGLPSNVLAAEQEIKNHITHRTGNQEDYTTFLAVLTAAGINYEHMAQPEFAALFQQWSASQTQNSPPASVSSNFGAAKSMATGRFPTAATNGFAAPVQSSLGTSMFASRNQTASSFAPSNNDLFGSASGFSSTIVPNPQSMNSSTQNLFGTATKNAFNAAVVPTSLYSMMNGGSSQSLFSQSANLQQAFTNDQSSLVNPSSNFLSGLGSNAMRTSQFSDNFTTAQTVASVLSNTGAVPSYSSASMVDKFKSNVGSDYLGNNFDYSNLLSSLPTSEAFNIYADRKHIADEGIASLGSSRTGSSNGSPSLDKPCTSPTMSSFPLINRSPLSSSDCSLTSSGSPPPSWSVGHSLGEAIQSNGLEALSVALSKTKIAADASVAASLDTSNIAVASAEKVLASLGSPSTDSSRRNSAATEAVMAC